MRITPGKDAKIDIDATRKNFLEPEGLVTIPVVIREKGLEVKCWAMIKASDVEYQLRLSEVVPSAG